VVIDGGTLIVTGLRPMPGQSRNTIIRRLEIPYGRFERRIELPAGRFEIGRRELADGCLSLTLRKLP
jgi:HSP20 family protein